MKTVKMLLMALVLLVSSSVFAAPSSNGLYATIQTTKGDVCFELYYTNVPRTVANFVSLAEGSRPWLDPRSSFISTDPYYNGGIFHRVISNFMIQCGSPKGDGTDGPGYTFEDEFSPALRHDRPGTVSMANSGLDSNGGQFFITAAATDWLDDKHSVFGRVVEGMNVVSNIAAVSTDAGDRPLEDITITNVFITRNGTNALNFAVTNQFLPEVEALPMMISSTNGIHLSTTTATASYQHVYFSTDLTGWEEAISDYWLVTDGAWNLIASGEPREFFHANRVVYAPDTNLPADFIGHRVVMSIGSAAFDVWISGSAAGTLIHNGGAVQPVTYWDRKSFPYHVKFRFQATEAAYWFDLYYTTPTAGRCVGYILYYGNWYYLNEDKESSTGTFTDERLNP